MRRGGYRHVRLHGKNGEREKRMTRMVSGNLCRHHLGKNVTYRSTYTKRVINVMEALGGNMVVQIIDVDLIGIVIIIEFHLQRRLYGIRGMVNQRLRCIPDGTRKNLHQRVHWI